MARENRLEMSPAEVREFLARLDVLILATLDKNDVPVGDVARYVLEDESLYFAIPREGPTHRNLQRDDRISCCAEQFPEYFEIAAVTVHGRATEVTAPEQVAHYQTALDALGAPVPTARAASDGATVLLTVPLSDDIMSFDFAKIANRARDVNH